MRLKAHVLSFGFCAPMTSSVRAVFGRFGGHGEGCTCGVELALKLAELTDMSEEFKKVKSDSLRLSPTAFKRIHGYAGRRIGRERFFYDVRRRKRWVLASC